MNDDKQSIKHSIESAESLLYKRCCQLRETIFMNDDYDPALVMNLASNIKLVSAIIIIAQCNKLKSSD